MTIQSRTRVPSAATKGKNGHALISDAKFRQLYALALHMRLLATGGNGHGAAARALAGREAALAGMAADLRVDDRILVRENPLLTQALHGAWPGSQRQEGSGSFSERMAEAVSGAAADRIRKNGRVTVIFCDDDVDGRVLEESRRMANAAKLPVLFVEDRREAEKTRSRSVQAQPHPEEITIPVDAEDVVAIYRVAHESIARAREGSGPTRVQCVSWKPAAKARRGAGAEEGDAVGHLELWLAARGLPAQEWRREIAAEFSNGKHEAEGRSRPSANSGAHAAPGFSHSEGDSPSTIPA